VAQKQKKDSVINAIDAALYRFFLKFAPFLADGQDRKALVFIFIFYYIFQVQAIPRWWAGPQGNTVFSKVLLECVLSLECVLF
jgi:hypothetical protein